MWLYWRLFLIGLALENPTWGVRRIAAGPRTPSPRTP